MDMKEDVERLWIVTEVADREALFTGITTCGEKGEDEDVDFWIFLSTTRRDDVPKIKDCVTPSHILKTDFALIKNLSSSSPPPKKKQKGAWAQRGSN